MFKPVRHHQNAHSISTPPPLTPDASPARSTRSSCSSMPATPDTILGLDSDEFITPIPFKLAKSGLVRATPDAKASISDVTCLLPCPPKDEEAVGWLFPRDNLTKGPNPSMTTVSPEIIVDFCGPNMPTFTSKPFSSPGATTRSWRLKPKKELHPIAQGSAQSLVPSGLTLPQDNHVFVLQDSATAVPLAPTPRIERLIQSHETRTSMILSPNLLEWYQNNDRHCAAGLKSNPDKRCSKAIRARLSKEQVRQLVTDATGTSDVSTLFDTLDVLIEAVLCKSGGKSSHHSLARKALSLFQDEHVSSAGPVLQTWFKKIAAHSSAESTPVGPGEATASPAVNTAMTPPSPPRNVTTRSMTKTANAAASEHARSVHLSVTKNKTKSEADAVAAPIYQPYRPKNQIGLEPSDLIRKRLCKPLTKTELEDRFLYVFWYPGNFGYVKHGVTKDMEGRFKAWRTQCKHDIQECLDKEMWAKVKVKFAGRLEKLVHAELKEFRVEELNCKCGVKHIEWFKTSPQHVKAVIKKWTDFISSADRYECWIGGKLIKENTSKAEVERLCQPTRKPEDFTWNPSLPLKFQSLEQQTKSLGSPASRRRSARQRGIGPENGGLPIMRRDEIVIKRRRTSACSHKHLPNEYLGVIAPVDPMAEEAQDRLRARRTPSKPKNEPKQGLTGCSSLHPQLVRLLDKLGLPQKQSASSVPPSGTSSRLQIIRHADHKNWTWQFRVLMNALVADQSTFVVRFRV